MRFHNCISRSTLRFHIIFSFFLLSASVRKRIYPLWVQDKWKVSKKFSSVSVFLHLRLLLLSFNLKFRARSNFSIIFFFFVLLLFFRTRRKENENFLFVCFNSLQEKRKISPLPNGLSLVFRIFAFFVTVFDFFVIQCVEIIKQNENLFSPIKAFNLQTAKRVLDIFSVLAKVVHGNQNVSCADVFTSFRIFSTIFTDLISISFECLLSYINFRLSRINLPISALLICFNRLLVRKKEKNIVLLCKHLVMFCLHQHKGNF